MDLIVTVVLLQVALQIMAYRIGYENGRENLRMEYKRVKLANKFAAGMKDGSDLSGCFGQAVSLMKEEREPAKYPEYYN